MLGRRGRGGLRGGGADVAVRGVAILDAVAAGVEGSAS